MSKYIHGGFRNVVYRLLEDVNTPRSLTVKLMLDAGDLRGIASLRCDPMHYSDPESFARDNLVTEFLRKLDVKGDDQSQLERECFDRLLATERLCFQTNQRLRRFLDGLLDQPGDARILGIIQDVRKMIRRLVGPLPSDLRSSGFGPGATLNNPSRLATIPDKIESVPSGTARALYLYNHLFRDSAWCRFRPANQRGKQVVCRGNRFFTVPKTATSLRGAALSPNVNGFLQKGIGRYLRSRLAGSGLHIGGQPTRNGFSINDWSSADRHRRLAKQSSLLGDMSTIDLSDASNTISFRLIELLWPSQWFSLLCDCREPFLQGPDGKWRKLEMFSAMGNGFTFELETITFWAICSVICKRSVHVFGDDIIVPTENAHDCLAALRFFGFVPNQRKTFVSGPFRESCGGDYFLGVNVRAHYQKVIPSTPAQYFALLNGLRRFSKIGNRWSYVRRAWWAALNEVPRHLRCCRGPEGLGDIVIHDDSFAPVLVKDSQLFYKAYMPIGQPLPLTHWPEWVIMASVLYGIPSDGILPRGSVSGYRVRKVVFS